MELSTKDMEKYIIQMSDEVIINKEMIIEFLVHNNVSYSMNKNGIFINLSLISDEIMGKFYKLYQDNINNSIDNDSYEEQCEIYLSEINTTKEPCNLNTSIEKKYNFNTLKLTDLQLRILNLI